MDVEFYFDPVCTWCWVASRWLVEVAPLRDLRLSWRSFSKLIGLGTQGLRDRELIVRTASHRALRVVEAVRADRPDAVQRLYEALTASAMVDDARVGQPFSNLPCTLRAAGLDECYAAAAHDERWDEAIRRSMAGAVAAVGDGAGPPLTVLRLDRRVGFHGPLVSPAPSGQDALELWDAVVKVAQVPGVFEISRPRPSRPRLSPPWSSPASLAIRTTFRGGR
jgi:predicted DsbA family dithiol-disulfide isomerase